MAPILSRCVLLASFLVGSGARAQVDFQFDYSFDAGGFFSGANESRRGILETAADAFRSRLMDSLSAIAPGSGNTWEAAFYNPSSGSVTSVTDPTVTANTILIYVGARDLGSTTLGQGGPGGYNASGDSSFLDAVATRGQTYAPGTDFGTWGGSVTFSSTAAWYFDSNPSTVESFTGQADFYSTAVHEIAHVLGFGLATSWNNLVTGGTFTGSDAVASYGAPVPVTGGHWQNGVISVLPVTGASQEAAMDPSIFDGSRKFFTGLDYAGLNDMGWDVSPVPEPRQMALAVALGLIGFGVIRRRALSTAE